MIRPCLRGRHPGKHAARTVENSQKGEEFFILYLQARFLKRDKLRRRSSVIDEYVYAPELRNRLADHTVHCLRVADIRRYGNRTMSCVVQLEACLSRRLFVHVIDCESRAVFGQKPCSRLADALTGARHQRYVSYEFHFSLHLYCPATRAFVGICKTSHDQPLPR